MEGIWKRGRKKWKSSLVFGYAWSAQLLPFWKFRGRDLRRAAMIWKPYPLTSLLPILQYLNNIVHLISTLSSKNNNYQYFHYVCWFFDEKLSLESFMWIDSPSIFLRAEACCSVNIFSIFYTPSKPTIPSNNLCLNDWESTQTIQITQKIMILGITNKKSEIFLEFHSVLRNLFPKHLSIRSEIHASLHLPLFSMRKNKGHIIYCCLSK